MICRVSDSLRHRCPVSVQLALTVFRISAPASLIVTIRHALQRVLPLPDGRPLSRRSAGQACAWDSLGSPRDWLVATSGMNPDKRMRIAPHQGCVGSTNRPLRLRAIRVSPNASARLTELQPAFPSSPTRSRIRARFEVGRESGNVWLFRKVHGAQYASPPLSSISFCG